MAILNFFKANRKKLAELYGDNTEEFHRGVFLSSLGRSFAAMLFAVHFVVLFPGTSFLDSQTKLGLFPFIAVLVGLLFASAWLVERGKHKFARRLTSFTISSSTMLSVVFCGGFVNSHATPYLLAPLVVAFCISPKKEALITGGLTFLIPLVVDGLSTAMGWNIPNFTSRGSHAANVIFLMTTLIITISISLLYLQRVNEDLRDALNEEKRTYKEWAAVDPLTLIYNRRTFDTRLEKTHQEALMDEKEFAVLFLDLNAFKPINDEMGHQVGDEILIEVAKRLREHTRQDDCVARLGGDEFAVITPVCDPQLLNAMIKRIRNAIAEPITVEDKPYHISTSIGRAHFPRDAASIADLMRTADLDMYAEKMRDKLHAATPNGRTPLQQSASERSNAA